MKNRLHSFALQVGVCLIAACTLVGYRARLYAQKPIAPILDPASAMGPTNSPGKKSKHKSAPVSDGPAPAIQIPVTPLGFAPPALHYLGERLSQVSVSFLSEDSLLFTFRVPGLIPRERGSSGQSGQTGEEENIHTARHIRAYVLNLPTGAVTAEALWDVHDYGPYLSVLKDGRFLLRDRNSVQIGDSSLHLEPFLRFPGQVKAVDLDPDKRLLIANTTEPPAKASSAATSPASVATSANATASDSSGSLDEVPHMQSLLRILSLDTRTVLLFSRVAGVTHPPVDGEGYYEALRGSGSSWLISYQDFHGTSTPLITVESTCYPALDVLAHEAVLASACNSNGGRTLTAYRKSPTGNAISDKTQEVTKRGLWMLSTPPTKVWPLIAKAPEGRRFARATLDVTHSVSPSSPLDQQDIRGQNIQVYNIADGNVALAVNAHPVFDGGGNFALSPSGRRFAVLNGDAIQIFDLPPAPPIPAQPSVVSPVASPKH
jgi:hypothetical protein